MTGWTAIAATTAEGRPVSLTLPPGWSALRTAADDLDSQVTALLIGALPAETVPDVRAELGEEWRRLARVSAAAGAVLMGFGAARDETGRLVTASVLVAPRRWYPEEDDGGIAGPRHTVSLPIGRAVRSLRLTTSPTPIGEIAELVVRYTVDESWTLVFRTPAIDHTARLVAVFDTVAASLSVPDGAPEDDDEDDGPVFS
jgi:hypothetical protein